MGIVIKKVIVFAVILLKDKGSQQSEGAKGHKESP